MAISFVSAGTQAHFSLIEKRQRLDLPREQLTGFEPVEILVPNAADPLSVGGIKGKRPNKKDKLREAAGRMLPTQEK